MSHPASFIDRIGETASWSLRYLGTRDLETGWPQVYYSCEGGDFDPNDFDCDDFLCAGPCEDIKVRMDMISTREVDTPGGRVTEERRRMFTAAAVRYRDRITYHGDTYEIETEPIERYLMGPEKFRVCTVIKVS